MPPPTVERLAPAFLGVLGAHPVKRQLRLLHAQALQRFPPEEVCGGRSLLMFRRGPCASHKISHQAIYRQTIRDCSWGSSVEEPRVSPSSNALKMTAAAALTPSR